MTVDLFLLSKFKIIECDRNLLDLCGLTENVRKNKSEEMNLNF